MRGLFLPGAGSGWAFLGPGERQRRAGSEPFATTTYAKAQAPTPTSLGIA